MIELDTWRDLSKSQPNHEKTTIIQFMKISEFADWLDEIQSDCKFHKRDNFRKRDSQATRPKQSNAGSSGSDTFTCQSAGKPTRQIDTNGVPIVKRARFTLKCNCKARITANYPHGYEHFDGKDINVDQHGDKVVKVTYNWKHEHPIATVGHLNMSTLSKRMRSALRIVVRRGVTYPEIDKARNEYLESRKGNLTVPELLKIEPHHVRYERRIYLEQSALKSRSLESSLCLWGDEVVTQGGAASFAESIRCRLFEGQLHGAPKQDN